jgi:hypothetical protein
MYRRHWVWDRRLLVKSRSYARTPGWAVGNGEVISAPRPGALRTRPSEAGPLPHCAEVTSFKGSAKLLRFDTGLYALSIIGTGAARAAEASIALPMVQISNPTSEEFGTVELVATTGDCGFGLGPEGGTVLIKAPLGGGYVLVATYESPDRPNPPLEIEVRRLDRVANEAAPLITATAPSAVRRTRQIKLEISLHIERIGDQRLHPDGWAGSLGKRLRLEAFGIRPLEALAAQDIEYKAFGPNAEQTPWVTGGQLSGSRRRGLPLTGFAVRLAAHLRDRYDLEYQGAFFDSGISDTVRNGTPCVGRIPRDPLEAINVRVIERFEC